jgi:uncharacterized repeat protein (TIGR03803 family)
MKMFFRGILLVAVLAGCALPQASPFYSAAPALRIPLTGSYKVLHRFRSFGGGARPLTALTYARSTFYGTTFYGSPTSSSYNNFDDGTVFSMTKHGGTKTLYRFGSKHDDGLQPMGDLVSFDGKLYGTTSSGGVANRGAIYSITTAGVEKIVHSFYGGTDGGIPYAGLIDVNGILYGTTYAGGNYSGCYQNEGCGTAYSITPSGHKTILHSFAGGADGTGPAAPLLDVSGSLYGTTENGGDACGISGGCGTVFRITPNGKETVLHAFKGGSDGAFPRAPLIEVNGTLYGTTSEGGSSCAEVGEGCGTVFRITPSGREKVLYAFKGGDDGLEPVAGLVEANGLLYGTTYSGGGYTCLFRIGCGVVFAVTTTGSETIVHVFTGDYGNNGGQPSARLVYVDGKLYGTTFYGGGKQCSSVGCGVVFAVRP